jgi:hypothetical protein
MGKYGRLYQEVSAMRKALSLWGISLNLLYFGAAYLWMQTEAPVYRRSLMAAGLILLIPTLYLYFLDAAISFRYDRERLSVVRMLLTVAAVPVCYVCFDRTGGRLEWMNGYILFVLLLQVVALMQRMIQSRRYKDED